MGERIYDIGWSGGRRQFVFWGSKMEGRIVGYGPDRIAIDSFADYHGKKRGKMIEIFYHHMLGAAAVCCVAINAL